MRKQLVGFLFVLCLMSLPGSVNGEVKLRVQFKAGDVQKLTMTQKQSMAMEFPNQPKTKTEMEMELSVNNQVIMQDIDGEVIVQDTTGN